MTFGTVRLKLLADEFDVGEEELEVGEFVGGDEIS